MAEIERNSVSPKKEEGLRGDGTPKWYVVHTYSGHENKVKANIEKILRLKEPEIEQGLKKDGQEL